MAAINNECPSHLETTGKTEETNKYSLVAAHIRPEIMIPNIQNCIKLINRDDFDGSFKLRLPE